MEPHTASPDLVTGLYNILGLTSNPPAHSFVAGLLASPGKESTSLLPLGRSAKDWAVLHTVWYSSEWVPDEMATGMSRFSAA